MHDFVTTYSGNTFHFLSPTEDEINLKDIIHNLSMLCRYNGAVKRHYSVLQHSVAVSKIVYDITSDKSQALYGLFHDASEAYICDIPRPIKPYLKGYEDIEKKICETIYTKFNIDTSSDIVHFVDNNIVALEAKELFSTVPQWAYDYSNLNADKSLFKLKSRKTVVKEFKEQLIFLTEGSYH